jgi:hypothetical protein
MTDHIVADYFRNPCYWKIDGRPYFSIYELFKLVDGLGGVQQTREALDSFRRKATAAGLPGIHLNAVLWGVKILPGETAIASPKELLAALGFDSTTSYVWIHHVKLSEFPQSDYAQAARQIAAHWEKAGPEMGLPYYPNVTMGWDASPRTVQSDRFVNAGYPFMSTLRGNTPAAFERALRSMRAFLDRNPAQPKICNLNAWNEWTEGSYLEPDVNHKSEYLEAIRRVFPPA